MQRGNLRCDAGSIRAIVLGDVRAFSFRPRSIPSAAIALACVFWLTSGFARAQEAGATQAGASQADAAQHPLEAKTELVKLDVSVLDQTGNFVGGLEQKSFRILDNGIERPILFFTPVTAPARVVVMLETSPAVYLIQDEHIAAAYSLVGGLAADDQVALITYADVPKYAVPFTTDKNAFTAALGNIQYMIGMGSLNFYDSLSYVLDWLSPMPEKKAIVLLTTGLDSSSADRWTRLVDKVRKEDVVIFAVGLGGPLEGSMGVQGKKEKKKHNQNPEPSVADPASPNAPAMDKARGALLGLATLTGGRAYFPTSRADFDPMYREIASALRHQYVLGVAPQHDGQYHKLTVDVLNAKGEPVNTRKHTEYRVSAREGYIAPAQ